jgi:TfoX N-terminal domain
MRVMTDPLPILIRIRRAADAVEPDRVFPIRQRSRFQGVAPAAYEKTAQLRLMRMLSSFQGSMEQVLMAFDERTAERVRGILSDRRDLVERKMMGGICFMVSGSMCCGVTGSALMVRVGREAYRRTLAESHVRPMEFAGRRPTGFVLVDPEGYRTDAALTQWVQRGVQFVASLPAKGSSPKPRSKRTRI